MFIVKLKMVGLMHMGDVYMTVGEYETFDKAHAVVEDGVISVLSCQDCCVVYKGVDRSDSGEQSDYSHACGR